MNEVMSSTYPYLLQRYGPLLTLKHVVEVMHSTPNSLRMALSRRRHPFAVALAGARRQRGRRVYFDARRLAAVIDQEGIDGPVEIHSIKPRDPAVQQRSLPLMEVL